MTDTPNWNGVKRLFQQALDWPPHERHARLRERCGDDLALKAEVESLLATHAQAGDFAEEPAIELLHELRQSSDTQTLQSRGILHPGDRLGVYEIQSLLGSGGMGDVYRAKDTRLGRMVAIKILPDHLRTDPELRSRFNREAHAIAALNHPHICTLHDVGHQSGIDFLVLEYLDGETLAGRLEKGALPLDEALAHAVAIADALDKAHRAGIVHRDLKPANVMLTREGAKLIDFGLATLTAAKRIAGAATSMTVGAPSVVTGAHVLLGTVPYMAPEQLEGKPADARTDIFAFGVLVYEMVTGRHPFPGDSEAARVAAIVSSHPVPLRTAVAAAPPLLDHFVRRCLAKNPDERWQSARDLAHALQWISEERPGEHRSPRRASRQQLAMISAAALLLVATAGSAGWWWRSRDDRPDTARFEVFPPADANYGVIPVKPWPAVSPDGRTIAFTAQTDREQLWVRSVDGFDARRLPDTTNAMAPFWSPDGRYIGYIADGRVKKVPASGGPSETICETGSREVQQAQSATWSSAGTIVFGAQEGPLRQVPAAGGTPQPLTQLDTSRQETSHRHPYFLPDGRHFLYLARSVIPDQRGVYVGGLDGSTPTRVLNDDSNAIYAAGQLLFVRGTTLMAQPFDPVTRQVSGAAVQVATGMYIAPTMRYAPFSANGRTLVFRNTARELSEIRMVDRSGTLVSTVADRGSYDALELAGDDRHLVIAVRVPDTDRATVRVLDIVRGVPESITIDESDYANPVWSHDGRWLAFASQQTGVWDLYARAVDRSGGAMLLLRTPAIKMPQDWTPDDKSLIYTSEAAVWQLPLEGPRIPRRISTSRAVEAGHDEAGHVRLSPDGRWLSYTSIESGRPEVYVQDFPAGKDTWRVSAAGGTHARWRADSKEILYLAGDNMVMSVDVAAGDALQPKTPRPLFRLNVVPEQLAIGSVFAISSDGQRFVIQHVLDSRPAPLSVVLGWNSLGGAMR